MTFNLLFSGSNTPTGEVLDTDKVVTDNRLAEMGIWSVRRPQDKRDPRVEKDAWPRHGDIWRDGCEGEGGE